MHRSPNPLSTALACLLAAPGLVAAREAADAPTVEEFVARSLGSAVEETAEGAAQSAP